MEAYAKATTIRDAAARYKAGLLKYAQIGY